MQWATLSPIFLSKAFSWDKLALREGWSLPKFPLTSNPLNQTHQFQDSWGYFTERICGKVLENELSEICGREPLIQRITSCVKKKLDWYSSEGGLSKHRSSHRRFSIKEGVLKNFAKLTGKHLCQSLFLIKLQVLGLELY